MEGDLLEQRSCSNLVTKREKVGTRFEKHLIVPLIMQLNMRKYKFNNFITKKWLAQLY